ncbi:ABC transporter substrate-binding protein [Actinomadura rugatobispora]|uniref:ABC transporter substrate-binding protein n=1 Tax=Actinomadura rugatobispora TaxID=1994 RepID=A0ABW1ADY0_9ACTN|nr:ABC transporter substrate-binding protein [Actinomadura rugatobispora]
MIVNRRRRRPLPLVVSVLALLLAVTGCALEGDPAGGETGSDGLKVVKVGYLHTVAVDTHLWLGQVNGTFEKHGLKLQPVKFDTGIAESQALTGGSIDIAIMGAVAANFPARGQGKVFLLNDIEYDTAQLYVRKDSGIDSLADLAGKKVATTEGTTAHVFLHNALKAEKVDPEKVSIVNSPMPAAVNSFISGAVPAVALWVPFDLQVKKSVPGAKLLTSAGKYYPRTAIAGGWVARNSFYEKDKDTLKKIAAAWIEINAALLGDPDGSLRKVHQHAYRNDAPFEQVKHDFGFEKTFTGDQWATYYADGTAAGWLGRTTRTFVELGGLPEYKEPSTYFDPQIFLSAHKEAS